MYVVLSLFRNLCLNPRLCDICCSCFVCILSLFWEASFPKTGQVQKHSSFPMWASAMGHMCPQCGSFNCSHMILITRSPRAVKTFSRASPKHPQLGIGKHHLEKHYLLKMYHGQSQPNVHSDSLAFLPTHQCHLFPQNVRGSLLPIRSALPWVFWLQGTEAPRAWDLCRQEITFL